MTSVFDLRQEPHFWAKSQPTPPPNSLYCGVLQSQQHQDCHYYHLTRSHLYQCRSEDPTSYCQLQACISWITLLPFEEQTGDNTRFGFSLIYGRNREDFYTQNRDDLDNWLEALEQVCILRDVLTDFAIITQIGFGGQSQVLLAKNIYTKELVAIKHFDKGSFAKHPKRIEGLAREIETLRHIDHPRVMKLYRVYEDNQAVDLVTEFIPGETLFTSLSSHGHFSPSECDHFMRNFLELLAYLSSENILHRDLKPENIMIPNVNSRGDFKLIDFGFARKWTGVAIRETCGSLGYMAPEIIRTYAYGQTVDVYSAGMVFYVLTVGYSPFYAETREEVQRLNAQNDITFERSWKDVGDKYIRLIRDMTSTFPSQRKAAAQLIAEFDGNTHEK